MRVKHELNEFKVCNVLASAPSPKIMLSEFQNKTMGNSVRYLGYITEADTVGFSEYNIENSKLGRHLYAALWF